MGIMSLTNDVAGQTNVVPRFLHMQTSDTLSTITTAGYLNKNAAGLGYSFTPTDIMFAAYNDGSSGYDTAQFELSFATDGTITLQLSESSIALPTIANHIAVFTDTAGSLGEDVTLAINGGSIAAGLSGTAGSLRSYPATASKGYLALAGVANTGDTAYTLSNAASAAARTVIFPDSGQTSTTAILADNAGTQAIATGSLSLTLGNLTVAAGDITATLGNITATSGSVTAGSSANAGRFASYPTTAASGSLLLEAVDNASGNFSTTISNATAVAQSQAISIPDVGGATGRFLVGATATPFTTAHILASSGTGGLVADSGIATSAVQLNTNIKAGLTANIGGAGAGPIDVAVVGMTAASVVTATLASSSNAVSVLTALPGVDKFTVTFSADPGASAILNYVVFIAAQ